MKKTLIIVLLFISIGQVSFANNGNFSLNNKYTTIEKELPARYQKVVKNFIYNYKQKINKLSTKEQDSINDKVVKKIDHIIKSKYSKNISNSAQSKNILLTLELLKLEIWYLNNSDSEKWLIIDNNKTELNNTIWKLPKSLGKDYLNNFVKYIWVQTPNWKSIHIVAQDKISNEKMLRVKNILEHYLTDLPWSKFGADKSEIANNISNNNAVLALMNWQDDGSNPIEVNAQPLYENEIQIEWWKWYINQNYEHRDASYEEILHFVHDNWIWIDWKNWTEWKLPEFQKEIRKAQKNALSKKIWWRWSENKEWIEELTEENSLTQEYLASVIDSYYGLWWAWNEWKGWMWDIYIAKNRDDIKNKDKMWNELLNNTFFHSYITYNARIDSGFKGTFSLRYDKTISYTNHSQYLKDITLLWKNNTNVVVNQFDNNITWNSWINTVIFSWKEDEYNISKDGITTIVEDKILNRDWRNILINIEKIKFK